MSSRAADGHLHALPPGESRQLGSEEIEDAPNRGMLGGHVRRPDLECGDRRAFRSDAQQKTTVGFRGVGRRDAASGPAEEALHLVQDAAHGLGKRRRAPQ